MLEKVIFAGFGGQGVLLAGQIIAHSGMLEGKEVSWLPSYGPEMRGGTANCNVVISDSEVASPVIVEADSAVVMNRPSMEMFEKYINPGGLLIINSDLIEIEPTRKDIRVLKIPANTLAEQAGSVKTANTVVVGAYNRCAGIVDNKTIMDVVSKMMEGSKDHLIRMNEKALELGAMAADAQLN